MIAGWLEFHQFSLGLLAMMDDHPESIRKQYLEDVVKVAEAEERAEAYERLREYGKKLLPAQEWRQLDHQESNFQQQAGRALTAERFAILAQEGNHQARITRAQQKAEAAEAGLERVRLFATAADVALETGDPQRIRQTIQAIPGETLGAWMRTQYWLRAALETGQAEFAAQAEQEVEKVGFPRLKGQMRSLLAP
jgi:hypothetical protein